MTDCKRGCCKQARFFNLVSITRLSEEQVLVSCKDPFTKRIQERKLNITQAQWKRLEQEVTTPIQEIVGHLSPSEREFLQTGMVM